MRNKIYKLSIFFFLLLSLTAAFIPKDRYFEIAKSIEIFASLFKEVNHYYVEETSPTSMAKTAIESMLASLDPYTNYIPEDRIEDYRTMSTGEFAGVGAVLHEREGAFIITDVMLGYAADEGGLLIGDELININGIDIKGRPQESVERMLKGQDGSVVNLVVKRFGSESPLSLKLEYSKVKRKNVPYFGMVTNDIGLVQLTDFTQQASLEVKNAVIELKDQGAKKIILDLRENPGGLLNEAVDITNVFLDRGLDIVFMKGRSEEWSKNYTSTNEPVDTKMPLAILVNENSASASEIVSGVLQDYDRGVVVGRQSYGKGLVQTTTKLSYNSQLKVTVAKYYIPSGRCVQAIDYSHRNEFGIPIKLPESKREEFKTKNGRVVFDGAGVDPDVEKEKVVYAPITKALIDKNLIFDYATEFRIKNESIDSTRIFELDDAQYQNFVNWLKDKDYNYTTKMENTLEELVASSKSERYYSDIKKQIDNLRSGIDKNKELDLVNFKEEIKQVLEKEIATRYYLDRGKIEATFDNNPDVLAAIEILNSPEKYKEILAPQ
ncbi:S41 family peptidase [Flammeovirgaceae bacterium SG7u.111]|nr:S41 family peptidase [Flammeovirgaceae bacterium SG7u.132]WPO35574.1 S41 family peptidase [Flammeovirgaceae bacterium SG7u.111]